MLQEINKQGTFPSFRSLGCAFSQASDISQNIFLNLQSPVWVSLHYRQSKMPTILGILGHVKLQRTLAKYGYGAAMLVYLHFTPTSHSKQIV